MAAVKTPCIGVCSTGIGDSVCRGCKRFAHEIIHWNSYSEDERGAVMVRIDSLLATVIAERVLVVNENRLKRALVEQGVRVPPAASSSALVYLALRAFGSRLPGLPAIGCRARANAQALAPGALKDEIERTFYQLCCAHYERYFPGHM